MQIGQGLKVGQNLTGSTNSGLLKGNQAGVENDSTKGAATGTTGDMLVADAGSSVKADFSGLAVSKETPVNDNFSMTNGAAVNMAAAEETDAADKAGSAD